MPKRSRKQGDKKGRQSVLSSTGSDFTLYDFNGVGETCRMKKAASNAWMAEAKVVCGVPPKMKTKALAWYEKDLSDFDLTDDEGDINNNHNKEKQSSSKDGQTDRTTNCPADGVDEGRIYPQDLWFLIGCYIRPEDVLTFAQICRDTHLVTHSAIFWREMYHRYYDPMCDLPTSLQPVGMGRTHGLRTRVIKALYHMYKPFQDRLRCIAPFENDPDSVEGCRCLLMWYKKVKNLWHFSFKFRKEPTGRCSLYSKSDTSQKSLLDSANVYHNWEDNCCVIEVICHNFISVPPAVMGQVLVKTYISVGHGMRYHKLKLIFNQQYINHKYMLANSTTVIFDPVINVHVLHWYGPKYPF